MGPYSEKLSQVEKDIEGALKNINALCGVKESDTGLAPPAFWDLAADKMAMSHEQPLKVFAYLLIYVTK
jgi:26S proteasome regulatory subunit T1